MCTFTTLQTTILSVRHEAKAKTDGPIVQQAFRSQWIHKYHDPLDYIQLYNWCTTNKSWSKYQGKVLFTEQSVVTQKNDKGNAISVYFDINYCHKVSQLSM